MDKRIDVVRMIAGLTLWVEVQGVKVCLVLTDEEAEHLYQEIGEYLPKEVKMLKEKT